MDAMHDGSAKLRASGTNRIDVQRIEIPRKMRKGDALIEAYRELVGR